MNPRRLLPVLLLSFSAAALSQSATMAVPGMGQVMAGDGAEQPLNVRAQP